MTRSNRVLLGGAALLALSSCAHGRHHRTPVIGNRVPILPSENAATPDASIASVEVLLPAAETNADWPQPGGSADHSNGQLALGTTLTRAWSAQIAGGSNRERLAAAPVVAGGKLFVMDVNASVTAFDAASGQRLWSVNVATGDANRGSRFGGGVSFDDGKLFATDGLGDVVAMNPADGTILWHTKPGAPLRGAPAVSNGTIYALSQDNQLYALSQADGSLSWTQSGSLQSQGLFGVAAPASGQGTVVAGFSSGELNAYRYENGRTLWGDALSRSSISTSVSSVSDIDASPVIDRGIVFALGQGGRMVALEITSGRRLWEQNFAGLSTPWVAGEWIFAVTDDARLVCLARATGLVRWITQLHHFRNERHSKGPITWYGPTLAGGRLILANSLGEITAVAADTGVIGTTMRGASDGFALPPVVANSVLYTLDQRGRITAYR